MRRKKLTRIEPPSCDCNLCKDDAANRLDCKKYSNWVKRNMSKRSLMEPFDVEEVYDSDTSLSFDIESNMLSDDIIKILNEHISSGFRTDYRKFLDGVRISKNKQQRLMLEIKNILLEYYSKDVSDWGKDENR